jgi:hypothetical protein
VGQGGREDLERLVSYELKAIKPQANSPGMQIEGLRLLCFIAELLGLPEECLFPRDLHAGALRKRQRTWLLDRYRDLSNPTLDAENSCNLCCKCLDGEILGSLHSLGAY